MPKVVSGRDPVFRRLARAYCTELERWQTTLHVPEAPLEPCHHAAHVLRVSAAHMGDDALAQAARAFDRAYMDPNTPASQLHALRDRFLGHLNESVKRNAAHRRGASTPTSFGTSPK